MGVERLGLYYPGRFRLLFKAGFAKRGNPMNRSRAAVVPYQRDETTQRDDGGGAALFYLLSGSFFGLLTFVLWYVPRHV